MTDPEAAPVRFGAFEVDLRTGELRKSGVIARTSVMRFKNTTNAADRIASDLGVSYLLEGSVRTTTDRIGITVRLIETETASQLWAGQCERDVQNLLTLQREVAEAIAGQITTSLGVTRSNAYADALVERVGLPRKAHNRRSSARPGAV
jgi:hypothetical protein